MESNVERRIKVLWELAKAPASMSQAYIAAVVAVYSAAYQADLAPLDRESDFPRFGQGSPDFHPRISGFCELDVQNVHDGPVMQLVERVEAVPETMTRSYLALYRGALQRLEDMLNSNPPPSPAQRAAIEAQLAALRAELDPKIAQLEAFLSQLNNP
jgi:hypothetical protein